ncbi:MAG: polyprenyl synthetase family protein [Chloroflexi bacterium]|nr:polyprenyl synthetase family protein [Chloroflexota bacterium]
MSQAQAANIAERPRPELPSMFAEYRAGIGAALREALDKDRPAFDLLRYYMGWVDPQGNPAAGTEGKYVRPTLCLFSCESVGGSRENAMPAAAALELIHNFSLIHDDIQDRDETRHHRKTLWAIWGIPKALVAGNVLRIVADSTLDDLQSAGVPPSRVISVVNQLTNAYIEMIEGQYLDIYFEGRSEISLKQYLHMIARKTGALIRCAFTIGAVIGSTDADKDAASFKESGRALGFIFQVRDDILGIWGDERSTGKPVGADIRRKKNSFPAVYAMSAAKGADKRRLLDIYCKDEPDDTDVEDVLHIMEGLGVREHAHILAVDEGEAAIEALAGVEMDARARQEYKNLVEFLLYREH